MRKFMTECKDTKTGLSMVLSECSYNMAMLWIQDEVDRRDGYQFKLFGKDWEGLYVIRVLKGCTKIRDFFYDEERGYLLGE